MLDEANSEQHNIECNDNSGVYAGQRQRISNNTAILILNKQSSLSNTKAVLLVVAACQCTSIWHNRATQAVYDYTTLLLLKANKSPRAGDEQVQIEQRSCILIKRCILC